MSLLPLKAPARLAALALLLGALAAPAPARGDRITVAAAADLKFAMDEIAAAFRAANPADEVEVVYGSSGKFNAQIQQGAPYDLFFSADIAFPRGLAERGLAGSEVRAYALGRLVLWSSTLDATRLTLASLADPRIGRIAIANPKHAPYGRRAEEALRAAGLWAQVEPRLVYGESVAQAAQFVLTGNAQVGLVALSLALGAELAGKGGYRLVPAELHAPLEQGYVITRRAAANPLARRFADYVDAAPARAVLARYGFALPGEAGGR